MQRNIVVNGRRTSMKLEASVWNYLGEIAQGRGKTVSTIISEIETGLPDDADNLSGEVRMFVLNYYRKIAEGDKIGARLAELRHEHQETVAELMREIAELQEQVRHHQRTKNDRHSALARDIMDVLIKHAGPTALNE
ncbi:MAG: ribbon-helix-helix domain-containing protein [Alphaproteobacteria bacterium]